MMKKRTVKVALLGAGSVGSQVARLLLENREEFAKRTGGVDLELVGIAVRNVSAPRDTELPQELFTDDPRDLILRSEIVVELMGGINPARELIELALESGADVITANKALLAHHGTELFSRAERVGAQLYYEAAVGGAIPIIRPLRYNLAGDRIDRVLGIVNGTTNFILDRMHTAGDSFERSLEIATELGYAEADPTADVGGYDAQQKAAILASIAFHTQVPVDAVYREGITEVTAQQIADAEAAGYVVKLLAICERIFSDAGEQISARVYPALVPKDHPLASVHGGNNAIFVEAEAAGPLMFYGAGAGGVQTASAVLGDLISAARRHVLGGPGIGESMASNLPMVDINQIETAYQISLQVNDERGVLAEVAKKFSEHGVSVATLSQQRDAKNESSATLVIGTHRAPEGALRALVESLEQMSTVDRVAGVLRVEGE